MNAFKKISLVVAGTSIASVSFVQAQNTGKIDFLKQVKPILEMNCISCHNADHAHENGDLNLATKTAAADTITPGNPDKSSIYRRTVLDPESKKIMPPKEHSAPLPKETTEILRQWIAEGAEWPDNLTLKTVMKVDFKRDIKPILEKGGPLEPKAVETLRLWIEQGATWPKDLKLAGDGAMDEEMLLVTDIYNKIQATSKEKAESEMQKYSDGIPRALTNMPPVLFEMIPIPSGQFLMGSPETEAKRNADEGPQHQVKIDAFWMGKCEVTWNEYELFMYPNMNKDTNHVSDSADATARPTKPYVEMSFGMGKDGFPAISMTQHAANKYCQWLSAKTGHFYRLPTEAEWEYACRAGTTTAYSFGDDASQLGEYAWFGNNSLTPKDENNKYQLVGKKKPNPWGLYDMYGNVVEWTLDQYDPEFYKQFKDVVSNPWNKATKPYPHTARGGSWDDNAEKLRSAARRGSSAAWKIQDPQLPKSIWYLTDAQFLGFRVVRPLKTPTAAEMKMYWNNGVEHE